MNLATRTVRSLLPLLLLVSVLIALPARTAFAQAPSATLTASATTIVYGDDVDLTVQIDPAAAGESVSIVDADGNVVASGTTGNRGEFHATISPTAEITLHAEWGSVRSGDVTIRVHAVVSVSLGTVRLFDSAVVRGRVRPLHTGARVDVELTRGGNVVATRHPVIGSAGGFRARFHISKPGTYRARASFSDADHLRGSDLDGPRSTPLPSLRTGSRSRFVLLLERRLVALHYRLVAVDRVFDFRTADAVMAFRKVQRMQRTTTVDDAVWRALADPIVPKPRLATRRFHVEVDQTLQVLYTVEDQRITNIIHVSTGKPSTPTYDGSYRVDRKLAGYSAHELYYPSYFDGNRAIHGWPDVPSYAASHGCVRVPYWHAKWIFGLTPIGTRVLIYH